MTIKAFVSGCILLGACGAAQAYTVSATPGPVTTQPGAVTFATFDAPTLSAIGSVTGGAANDGSNPGGGGSWLSAPSTITVSLTGLGDYFGLVWGSPDGYNSLQFMRAGSAVSSAFTGTSSAGTGNYTNFLAANSSEYFDAVVLSSTSCCYEVDNFSARLTVTAAIPEPSTYALMLAGLGFVGFIAHRRRKAQAAA